MKKPDYSVDQLSASSPDAAFRSVTLSAGSIELSPLEDMDSEEPREGLALSIDLDGDRTIDIQLETGSALTAFNDTGQNLPRAGGKALDKLG